MCVREKKIIYRSRERIQEKTWRIEPSRIYGNTFKILSVLLTLRKGLKLCVAKGLRKQMVKKRCWYFLKSCDSAGPNSQFMTFSRLAMLWLLNLAHSWQTQSKQENWRISVLIPDHLQGFSWIWFSNTCRHMLYVKQNVTSTEAINTQKALKVHA